MSAAAQKAQETDGITSHRLIVSKTHWCRSCGGGAKTEAANWIVTGAVPRKAVLRVHWLPSRRLITRMNEINLAIQWSRNGTFRDSHRRVRFGLRGVERQPSGVNASDRGIWPTMYFLFKQARLKFSIFFHWSGSHPKKQFLCRSLLRASSHQQNISVHRSEEDEGVLRSRDLSKHGENPVSWLQLVVNDLKTHLSGRLPPSPQAPPT